MKTLKWIAAALTLVTMMGVAGAHDRDDFRRDNCAPYYGGYYVNPYYGGWGYSTPRFYGYGDRDGWGRWDRDRRDFDRDRRDHGRFERRGDRDGFRFRF